jgi:hypothetical protein
MTFTNGFIFATIMDTIEGLIGPYISTGISALEGFPIWIQGLMLLGLGLFAIIGIFVFIKKFFKLFLVLAILGAIGYYLYFETDIITNLLGNLTGAITNIFTTLL